jgi:hypothetical protein
MNISPLSVSHHNSPCLGSGGGLSPIIVGITVIVAAMPGCPEGF